MCKTKGKGQDYVGLIVDADEGVMVTGKCMSQQFRPNHCLQKRILTVGM